MFCLVKPRDFFQQVSRSPSLKLELTWLAFGGLVVPTALLMSIGFPARYALPLMLAAILPFQYAAYCILRGLKEPGAALVREKRVQREWVERDVALAREIQRMWEPATSSIAEQSIFSLARSYYKDVLRSAASAQAHKRYRDLIIERQRAALESSRTLLQSHADLWSQPCGVAPQMPRPEFAHIYSWGIEKAAYQMPHSARR